MSGRTGQLVLALDALATDPELQQRAAFSRTVTADYAEAMEGGAKFPPIVAFHDGENYWVADGHYRVAASRKIGAREIAVEVRPGSRRDAILYACGANDQHGARRTNKDKRRAVTTLLKDPEWGLATGAEIARWSGVTKQFVNQVRAELQSGNCFPAKDPPAPAPEEPWGPGDEAHAAESLSRAIKQHIAEYRSENTEPLIQILSIWLETLQGKQDERGSSGRRARPANGIGDRHHPDGQGKPPRPGRRQPVMESLPGRADR